MINISPYMTLTYRHLKFLSSNCTSKSCKKDTSKYRSVYSTHFYRLRN